MSRLWRVLRSVAVENVLVFAAILLLTISPLALFYLSDTERNLVNILSANVTVAAKRGADLLEVEQIAKITNPNYQFTVAFDDAVATLRRIQTDFELDNAVLYRWDDAAGQFVYIADGFGQFEIGSGVHIHAAFPATFEAARTAWKTGRLDDTRLFQSGESMFFQANLPLKTNGKVVAALLLNDDATRVAREIREQQRLILIGTGTIMVVGALAFWALTTLRMRPLVRLTGAAREIAEGNLDVAVPSTRTRNEIGELNTAFQKMVTDLRASRREIEEYSRSLEAKVQERTREIGNLLDNMDEGIFTMSAGGAIDPRYSIATETMLGSKSLAGTNFIDRAIPDESMRKSMRDTFELLLGPESTMSWDDMIENLPKEFRSDDGRWFRSRFRPISEDGNSAIARVMVILQDVTREKALQSDVDRQRAEQEMWVKVLQNRESFDLFCSDASSMLQSVREHVGALSIVRRATVDDAFRAMHTIKGTSALFAIHDVAAKAHELEEILRALGDMRDAEFPEAMRAGLLAGFDQIERGLREARDGVLNLVGESTSGGTQFTISEEKIDRITQNALEVAGHSASILKPLLARLKHIPAERLFKKYQSLVESIASRLGKSASLRIDATDDAELSRELFREIDPTILHLVRNAVDHGIEMPEVRESSHKPAHATITLNVSRSNGSLLFGVSDDGGGIDSGTIRQTAVNRGLITADGARNLTPGEIIRFLFMPRFSTKNEVSDLSGRGVGLDVVKHNVEKLGGRLRVTTKRKRGSRFEMTIPVTA